VHGLQARLDTKIKGKKVGQAAACGPTSVHTEGESRVVRHAGIINPNTGKREVKTRGTGKYFLLKRGIKPINDGGERGGYILTVLPNGSRLARKGRPVCCVQRRSVRKGGKISLQEISQRDFGGGKGRGNSDTGEAGVGDFPQETKLRNEIGRKTRSLSYETRNPVTRGTSPWRIQERPTESLQTSVEGGKIGKSRGGEKGGCFKELRVKFSRKNGRYTLVGNDKRR